MTRPRATYRLQFREGMTFKRAAELVPYLAELGISHLYASPLFAAAPGSTHGYDVVDVTRLAPELGGEDGFKTLCRALKDHGLGLIVDFVSNHMGASTHNPWWLDVLEWGEASNYAEHFDIDWSAPKLIIPALAANYGEELNNGAFGLSFDRSDGGISFSYGPMRLPLTPPSYAQLLSRIESEDFAELARRFIVAEPAESRALKQELADTCAADPATRDAVERVLAETAADLDAIHELHEAQVWRLAHWRAARETLTYRRFFEIADLVGLRVERASVFDDVHARLLELVAAGDIQGLRIDHVDGLADPKSYLEKLQEAGGTYLLVEKILGPDEDLRADWPADGTTGYEFILSLANLLVDPRGEEAMTAAYSAFLGEQTDYHALALETKRRLLARNLAGELDRLKDMALSLAAKDPMTRDYGPDTLRRAIIELTAALPVYRTYVNVAGPADADRDLIEAAAEAAKTTREVENEGALDFLKRMLLLDFAEPEDQATALEFATRFQQTTGPVMAKALEDTLFYRYNRLIALNEVGGEPERFGARPEQFHSAMTRRLARQPFGLSTTSTHDTKRAEDARARIYAISEMPDGWAAAVARWSGMNAGLREADGLTLDPETEWAFYQALLGVWPPTLMPDDGEGLNALADRMVQFMLKAVREAKSFTSWTAQDADYEGVVERFTRGALDPVRSRVFLDDFLRTCEPLFVAGALNSLSQTLIKLTAPGVPDIYQGCELWDFSLVDPDNRRPVDFGIRHALAQKDGSDDPAALMRDWRSGAAKMHVLRAGLSLRARKSALFAEGAYRPLVLAGPGADKLIAFARVHGAEAVVVIVPLLSVGLLAGRSSPLIPAAVWEDTALQLPDDLRARSWRNLLDPGAGFSGEAVRIDRLLANFPGALLSAG
ncbi:malto-oligosyltrehalose synthase [Dichotomicrobium thermohalophilum]|uniref:Maltooligosyl trehalose synthase n=1 Tax=Dichotomicrobium thermohalophilum TaxID=933063 RepID=A0A397Q352_9HYPH|nr:malto-oligosyltrehalose synthase [Dichotomicrobium thermohalophilum]RIA55950.1 maltooligosyl trehalose synthase [Dichotomicrobium thermohalophilum]